MTYLTIETVRVITQHTQDFTFIRGVLDELMARPLKNATQIALLKKRLFALEQEAPTETLTEAPTETLTEVPTETPTETPTEAPTETPTETPTEAPTETPTEAPTVLSLETVLQIIKQKPSREVTIYMIDSLSLDSWGNTHQICALQRYLFSLDPEMHMKPKPKPQPKPEQQLWMKLRGAIRKKSKPQL